MFALSIPQEIVLSIVTELTPTVQCTGGYVWQYWLSTGGPRWAMKIISDRQKVQNSRCHQIILNFDMRKPVLILICNDRLDSNWERKCLRSSPVMQRSNDILFLGSLVSAAL